MIPFESKRGGKKGEEEVERAAMGIRGMVARLERRKDKQVAEMIVMMPLC